MKLSHSPPPVLDSAQVIEYAVLDRTVRWTGTQVLFVNGKLQGAVPRLAICKTLFGNSNEYFIFHCDKKWNVLGVSEAPTVRECKQRAEQWYDGLSALWVKTGTSKIEAERWLRQACAKYACSLCRRLPVEAEGMFNKGAVNVCFKCVGEMHASLVASATHDGT
jgi:hypothetical protein